MYEWLMNVKKTADMCLEVLRFLIQIHSIKYGLHIKKTGLQYCVASLFLDPYKVHYLFINWYCVSKGTLNKPSNSDLFFL